MNMKTVAVITRTKDRILFLDRAIMSVHNQTFSDFIHVIINDGGNAKQVDELVKKHSDLIKDRVKVIHNAESKGMEAASNLGIRSVDSKYVAIHDDDDTWDKDFLKLAIVKLEATDSAGVVVRTDKVVERVSANGKEIEKLKSVPWMPDMKVVNLYRQCIDNQMTPITFLYKREVFKSIGYYDESLPVLGDWDFGIRFLQKYDVEFLDPGYALAFYHHRRFVPGSKTNNSFGDGTEKHRYWSNRLMNRYLREELDEGKLGVGYIMSRLKYDRSNMAKIVSRLLPGFINKRLRSRIYR